MDLHKKTRHIIPVAFDLDGVFEGIRQRPPNQVILLYLYTEENREEKIAKRNVNKIIKALGSTIDIKVHIIEKNNASAINDALEHILSTYSIKHWVTYTNITSGTPILNALLLLHALKHRYHSYAVVPKKVEIPAYKTELTRGVSEVFFTPQVSLTLPSGRGMKILRVLSEMGGVAGSQKSLLDKLEKRKFFKEEKYFKRRQKKIMANRKTMLSRIIRELENGGLVEKRTRGRDNIIELTEEGLFMIGGGSIGKGSFGKSGK